MTSGGRSSRLGFVVVAAPVVVASASRVARLDRELGFDSLVTALRSGAGRPLPPWLAQPERLAETVEQLLPLLPPRRYGVCLRRALILLDLWSRCGLRPVLHLAFSAAAPVPGGHAWLSAAATDGSRYQVSGPLDAGPVFEL